MWKRKQLNFYGSGNTLKKEAGSGSKKYSFASTYLLYNLELKNSMNEKTKLRWISTEYLIAHPSEGLISTNQQPRNKIQFSFRSILAMKAHM